MTEIRNFTEAYATLQPFVPLVAQLTGNNTTLSRIRPLLKLAGNPQKQLRAVHIAGTSGKTSTAYFVAGLLRASGQKVGLTVSPHIDSIAERVQLDGQPMSEAAFCAALGEFMQLVERLAVQPSYFELLYAFSLWVFAREGVDYAVIETGMGGLHDATNIIDNPDKLCVITDIGFDHMHILGNTIEQIAAQKAGIIHEHNTAIMYEQSAVVTTVFRTWATEHSATLLLTSETAERSDYASDFTPHFPRFQQRNWLLARRAYNYLEQRDGLPLLDTQQLLRTQQIQVPARMDCRTIGDKLVIMDGAHNEQKMTAFLDSFKLEFPEAKPAVLLAMKQGKEVSDVGKLFAPLASRVIVTTFNTSQDLPAVSVDPAEISAIFRDEGMTDVQVIVDQHVALNALLNGPESVCVITGSFYLISQLRNLMELQA